ncbi:hypothetical protein GUITHDRAFT_116780 [Guillardia theta CCMP2712]|uniref:Selenoprotein H n=1 Tax=Guillardia theta (strain CCMP2712) TaxID=905079 RepID=L1IMC6_GUITC|nr:hypothetical protein GUITHDRAFT_116780 [Guillardia theta CCMP2712]EKX37054.1 hypothetical protein GUITHDRAFT_116780 [Guillardia theta CCMP2712]|eukprot:XP_005824034.1 hypothetical protein GUITHDRAFT_116780 [Guillardia theta CCMP2712]
MAGKRKSAGGEGKASKKAAKVEKDEKVEKSSSSTAKLEKLLKEAKISVEINPEKPRKGCFEVRLGNGDKIVSLLDMPRPFTKLKALDIDEVAEKVKAAV